MTVQPLDVVGGLGEVLGRALAQIVVVRVMQVRRLEPSLEQALCRGVLAVLVVLPELCLGMEDAGCGRCAGAVDGGGHALGR